MSASISLAASGSAIERLVEFRDGARITLDLPATELLLTLEAKGAGTTPQRIALANTREVLLSKIPALDRMRRIDESLKALNSDEFSAREQAGQTLREIGGSFRDLLQRKLDAALEPEIRWRLARIVGNLHDEIDGNGFDLVRLGETRLAGELARLQIPVTYRDVQFSLDRSTVRSIRAPDTAAGTDNDAAENPGERSPHADRFTLFLSDGARLHCHGFIACDDGISVALSSGFAELITIPHRDLVSLMSPGTGRSPAVSPSSRPLWALLRDGSKLHIDYSDAPGNPQTQHGKLPLASLPLSALWNGKTERRHPLAPLTIPKGGAALLLRNDPVYLREVELRKREIASSRQDASLLLQNYARLPTVWFSPPPKTPSPAWGQIDLTSGERLMFGKGAYFSLLSIPSAAEGLQLQADAGEPFTIRFKQIRSIRFPKAP